MSNLVVSEELKDLWAKKAAELFISGVGINQRVKDMSDEFKVPFTRTMLNALETRPAFVEVLSEKGQIGKVKLKALAVQHAGKIVDTLVSAMACGNQSTEVRAAATLGAFLTDKDTQEGPQQAQQVTVVLPDGVLPSLDAVVKK